jgi:hypothetical protein
MILLYEVLVPFKTIEGIMFVRFKRVKLATRIGRTPHYSIHAVLVENHRKNGKPRQRIVKYLCSTRQAKLLNRHGREDFFREIIRKLEYVDLDPRVLAKIKVRLINFFVHQIPKYPLDNE